MKYVAGLVNIQNEQKHSASINVPSSAHPIVVLYMILNISLFSFFKNHFSQWVILLWVGYILLTCILTLTLWKYDILYKQSIWVPPSSLVHLYQETLLTLSWKRTHCNKISDPEAEWTERAVCICVWLQWVTPPLYAWGGRLNLQSEEWFSSSAGSVGFRPQRGVTPGWVKSLFSEFQ